MVELKYVGPELNAAQRGTVATILDEADGSVQIVAMSDGILIIDGDHRWNVAPNGEAVHSLSPYAIGNPD